MIKTEGIRGTDRSLWHWAYVWIPAVPSDQPESADVGQSRVIIGTKNVSDENQLLEFCRRTSFEGLIVNATDSLGGEERKLLNQGLPGIDVGSCYFIREGQKLAGGLWQAGLLVGGPLVLLAGLALGGLLLKEKYAK